MSKLIGVVNYGMAGNIYSIKKAIEAAGGDVLVLDTPAELDRVDKIVIPGVGSYKDAMSELESSGFLDSLRATTKPILGICLGMQILSSLGFEYGKTQGLGLIHGEVKPMICDSQIPHMGFNALEMVSSHPLLAGVENELFYFMHSYELVNYTNILSLTTYSNHRFVSAIQKGSIYGVQFHPEKSREPGIRVFKNFIEMETV